MSNKISKLTPPDSFYVHAAQGWLGLGDADSALDELAQVSPRNSEHPSVLLIRYEIYAKTKEWTLAALAAEKLTTIVSERSDVWIWYAYATRRQPGGGVLAAKEILVSSESNFPDEFLFPFNLACYCSLLGLFEETAMWLKKAAKLGNSKVKRMATEDEDLKPFWSSNAGTEWTWD